MATEIPLTSGMVAIVDDCDADLSCIGWYCSKSCKTFYARRSAYCDGRQLTERLHRVIWSRMHPDSGDDFLVDHADGDGLNCRRSNLRVATKSQNNRNVSIRKDNRSGFKGVSRRGKWNRWVAQICVNGRVRHIGYYKTPEAAAKAYDDVARSEFGEFAVLNFARVGERSACLIGASHGQ